MKKLLAVLASLSLTSALSSSVISCGDKEDPEFAEDQEIFSVEPQQTKLELDENGKQVEDFNFNLNYVLTSPTTGDDTNIQIQSAKIAADGEKPSDDTRRFGTFLTIEEVKNSDDEGEPQVNYYLKFTGDIDDFDYNSEDDFNLAINFKGQYFQNEEFSVTLYFRFLLINNYRADLKRDLKDYISEEKRHLGLIEDVNDVLEEEKAQVLIQVAVYKTFDNLFKEVDLNFNLEKKKEVQVVAKQNSEIFKGDVILTYDHDQNPQLLPDVSDGIDLNELAVDRLAFSKLDFDAKVQLIKDPLKKWYLIEKGQDYTNLYFQYFEVDNIVVGVDHAEALIKFETPWSDVNKEFQARFKVPYASMAEKLPADLFAEKLLDMNASTMDELILRKLSQKANEQIPDFDDLFEFGTLDVGKQTIEIVAKTKEKDQIYEPQAKLELNFNVQKINLEDLIGDKLKGYSFDARRSDVWYLIIKELCLGRIRTDVNSRLTTEERTLITLDNEFNDLNFDTTDPDKWTLKITPSLNAQRYVTGEIAFQYTNPIPSSLISPRNWDYDTPGRNQILQLDAPFLVSTQEEVQASYLKTLKRVCSANPFAKWVVLVNPQDVEIKIPDQILSYSLFGDEKVKNYLAPYSSIGQFKLASLDLETYFFGGIKINTPLESTSPSTIAQELYEMIIGDKESDFKPFPNLANVVEVIDVISDPGNKTGTAALQVRSTYPYKDAVLNQAEITFKLR